MDVVESVEDLAIDVQALADEFGGTHRILVTDGGLLTAEPHGEGDTLRADSPPALRQQLYRVAPRAAGGSGG